MKYVMLVAAGAAFLLSGCGSDGGRQHHAAYSTLGERAVDYGDGYYDGFYGPFVDGYWGADNFFYYKDPDNRWRRDEGHHFRHDAAGGFNHVHGSGHH